MNNSLDDDRSSSKETSILENGTKSPTIVDVSKPSTNDIQKKTDLFERQKKEIEKALKDRNYSKLKEFAHSEGGILTDELRRQVWPRLLDIDIDKAEAPPSEEQLKSHKEYHQIVLDVNRSLKRFPPGIPYDRRVALQDQLTHLILRVIYKYPHLRYYQGYHDVAVTFLLVVEEDPAFQILEKLSMNHFKDCMEPTMDKTSRLLHYIYPLIERINPNLAEYLERSGVGTLFCLPWYLTWFGHSLNHYEDVVRLYDYFLASPPLAPLYLAAALVAFRAEEVFNTECEMANIHQLLSTIPDKIPFEEIITTATELYQSFPPDSIHNEVELRIIREQEQRQRDDAALRKRRSTMSSSTNRRIEKASSRWSRLLRNAPPKIGLLIASATIIVGGIFAYWRNNNLVDLPSIMD